MVLDSIGIVACYGRPFKGRGGKPAVAEPFLHILSTDERALHDRLIDMRDKDHAHGDLYQGRVRIQPGDADLWIRTGIDPSMVTPEDIRTTIRHATRLTVRGPTRAEIAHLRWLAIKFGFEFQRAAKELAPQVLSARIRAGDLDWFALAEP